MSNESNWLFFTLRNKQYAVSASEIKEILWLLPLTQTLLGGRSVFAQTNHRGEHTLIFDLHLFWDGDPMPISKDGNVLILEGNLGFIIDSIVGVKKITRPFVSPPKEGHGIWEERILDGESVTLLDITQFYPQDRFPLTENYIHQSDLRKQNWYKFAYQALGEEFLSSLSRREIEENSEVSVQSGVNEGLLPYSIVKVGKETVGINLENILEFSDPIQLTPVPNANPILSGFMNLRGDVLPVLSLQQLLQSEDPASFVGKVIIVKTEDVSFGLLVDELIDVVYEKSENRLPPPLGSRVDSDGILEGTFIINQNFVSLVSVSQIIKKAKESL